MNITERWERIQDKIGAHVDGDPGPETIGKLEVALGIITEAPAVEPVTESDRVDERSEKAVETLHPKVQPYARALVHRAAHQGIVIKLTSGTRTCEEQNELFTHGRTAPGPKVTNCKCGESNHNFGIAFDVTIFDGSNPVWDSPLYKVVGAIGKSLGLTWGGSWSGFSDEPHFELRPQWADELSEPKMLAGLRDRQESGKDAFA